MKKIEAWLSKKGLKNKRTLIVVIAFVLFIIFLFLFFSIDRARPRHDCHIFIINHYFTNIFVGKKKKGKMGLGCSLAVRVELRL